MRPEAVIFDLDGTLADSAPDIHFALSAVLTQNGLPWLGRETVRLMIGGGPVVLIERAFEELEIVATTEEIENLSSSFVRTYLELGNSRTTLIGGAETCLKQLASENIPIGLCSNKPEHICNQLLTDLNVRHFFAAIQGSGTGLPTKPHPGSLQAILHRLNSTPQAALYVGDSRTDVDTARNAGVPVVLVRSGYTEVPADTLGADWVVERLSDVAAIWQ